MNWRSILICSEQNEDLFQYSLEKLCVIIPSNIGTDRNYQLPYIYRKELEFDSLKLILLKHYLN